MNLRLSSVCVCVCSTESWGGGTAAEEIQINVHLHSFVMVDCHPVLLAKLTRLRKDYVIFNDI